MTDHCLREKKPSRRPLSKNPQQVEVGVIMNQRNDVHD
jgi:hypothetical protein